MRSPNGAIELEIEIGPQLPSEPMSACVFVKRTFDLVHGRRMTRSREVEIPFHLEPIGENADGTEPVDCPIAEWDLAPRKPMVVRIGEAWKHVDVIGDRRVSWRSGSSQPSFGAPEPFVELSLTWRRAYGGIDASVPPRKPCDDILELLAAFTPGRHPGAYPRNTAGVGWVVHADRSRLDGLRLPNFETPEHLLTPEHLVLGSAGRWPWAPEPAGFGWIGQTWFPRSMLIGLEPKFGLLPEHLREGWLELPPEFIGGSDPRFYSGASSGMRRVDLRGDELVELHGFRHEGAVSTGLPGEPPRVSIMLRRRPLEVVTRLHTIELFVDRGLASMLWVAEARMPQVMPLNFPGVGAEEFDVLEGVDVLLDGVALPSDLLG